MPTISWIHLSDFHFRSVNQLDAEFVLKSFLEDVETKIDLLCLKPNFVIITGDIAFQSREEEYALAQEFFDKLLKVTELSKDRLFVVPGNHDIDRGMITAGARAIAKSLDNRNSLFEVLSNNDDRHLIFLKFLKYSNFIDNYFKKHLSFDDKIFYYTRCFKVGDVAIAVLGLNSALLCMDDDDQGRLALSDYQVRNALEATKEADLRISIMHHPFGWFNDYDAADCEPLLMNACDFILHGHLHRTGILNLSTPDAQAMIIAAGACYESSKFLNRYNIVTVDSDTGEGVVYLRLYSDSQGGFWTNDGMAYQKVENGQFSFAIQPKAAIDPMTGYLTELIMDLSPWRGIGLESPINIEDIFVSNIVLERSSNREITYEESQISNDFFKDKKKILIEGAAGIGKSTLLKHWAIHFAENSAGTPEQKIPLFLTLEYVESICSASNKWELSLTDLVAKRFSKYLPQSSDSLNAALVQAINAGQALILLDGFDEVTEENRKNMINWIDIVRKNAYSCPIVVTSRPTMNDYGFDQFSKLYLESFDQSRQKTFIKNWFKNDPQPNKGESVYELMTSDSNFSLRVISGNPLCLTMVCIDFDYSKKIPKTPAELIDKFTRLLVFNYKTPAESNYRGDIKLQVLELAADYFFERKQIEFSERDLIDVVKKEFPALKSTYELLKEISKYTGFIIRDRYGNWRFSHLLFQEFFTAAFHMRQRQRGVNQSKWLHQTHFVQKDRYENVNQYYAHLSQKDISND